MNLSSLEQRMMEDGIAEVGYSDLTGLLPERFSFLTYGITLLFRLSDAVVDEVDDAPTISYFQHYRAVNAFLDSWTLRLTALIEREGSRAFPIAASQSLPGKDNYQALFSHKTAAVRAGLGWIGKSALFVSPRFGPRVRLATVLTNLTLPTNPPPVYKGCGGCRICVDLCPAGAISGREYVPGAERETIFDPELCSRHMKKAYQHIGRWAVCGICMAHCPFGKAEL